VTILLRYTAFSIQGICWSDSQS